MGGKEIQHWDGIGHADTGEVEWLLVSRNGNAWRDGGRNGMTNEPTAVFERDGDWWIACCPDIPAERFIADYENRRN